MAAVAFNSGRIVAAIEARINGSNTTGPRAITPNALNANVYPSLNDGAKAQRALECPQFSAIVQRQSRDAGGMMSESGPTQIIRIGVEIVTTFHLGPEAKADVSRLKALRALAVDLNETVRASLAFPGSVSLDPDGNPTGVISGALQIEDAVRLRREELNADPGILEFEARYLGRVYILTPI